MMKNILLFALIFTTAVTWAQTPTEVIHKPAIKSKCSKPTKSFSLSEKIPEGSGLIPWNGQLWCHNDSGDSHLYALDTLSGNITATYNLPIANDDWEDISHDSQYFYLGAIGNNLGDKKIRNIFRMEKASLLRQRPVIDTIVFTWPETMHKGKIEQTNFDCEALTVIGDSIYIFTKEWKKGRRARVFSLPKSPGNYTAQYKFTLKTRVVITGASWHEASRQLVLCGYNFWLRPFLLVFPDVNDANFFSGKGTKIRIKKRFRQVEGVATFNGTEYFLINEAFHFLFIKTGPELHQLTVPK